EVVVKIIGKSRRPGCGTESEQAAFTQGAAFGVIVGTGRLEAHIPAFLHVRCWPGQQCEHSFSSGRVEGRRTAVGRIDHDRRADLAVDYGVARARIEPEIVVATYSSGRSSGSVATFRRRRSIALDRLICFVALGSGVLLEFDRFFGSEHGFGSGRPLER